VADMVRGGRSGPLYKPGQPDESRLIRVISGPEPAMPQKEPPLSPDKVQVLRLWVLAGARDDTPADTSRAAVKAPETYPFAPAVSSVAFTPDGKRRAAACRSEVVLLTVEGDPHPRRLPTSSDLLVRVEFSPDGKLLAAAGGTPGQYGEV